jgi:TonB family protein
MVLVRIVGLLAVAGALSVPLFAQTSPGIPGPIEQRAKVATADNPVPRTLAAPAPLFPAEARASGPTADVSVRVTVDASGGVAEAREIGVSVNPSGAALAGLITGAQSGNVQESSVLTEAFARSALDAVRRWQFAPPGDAPLAFDVRFRFSPSAATQALVVSAERDIMQERAMSLARAEAQAARDAAPNWPETGGVTPVRVGGTVRGPRQTRFVPPVYPGGLAEPTIQGIIILDVLIGGDGRVAQARVLSGHPMLSGAALDAVRQWEFEPTLLNGVPVPLVMTVTVGFSR